MADPKTVLEFAKRNDVKILDLRFTDLPGLWHHISYPVEQLTEACFEEGFGMDGSSIRGWAAIHESDMLLIPDPASHLLDPFTEVSTLVMIADVIDPVTKQRYDRDPRYIAKKAEMYLSSTGLADTAYFGAEAEFFIFDNVRFDQREQHDRQQRHRRGRPIELGPQAMVEADGGAIPVEHRPLHAPAPTPDRDAGQGAALRRSISRSLRELARWRCHSSSLDRFG